MTPPTYTMCTRLPAFDLAGKVALVTSACRAIIGTALIVGALTYVAVMAPGLLVEQILLDASR